MRLQKATCAAHRGTGNAAGLRFVRTQIGIFIKNALGSRRQSYAFAIDQVMLKSRAMPQCGIPGGR